MIKKLVVLAAVPLIVYVLGAFIGAVTAWDTSMLDPANWMPVGRFGCVLATLLVELFAAINMFVRGKP
jgi:hypothetical protein